MTVLRLNDTSGNEQGGVKEVKGMVRTEDEFLPRFQGVDGKRCFNDQLAPPEVVSYAAGITYHAGDGRLVVVQVRL